MGARAEQKLKTRRAIMDAALHLLSESRSLASLSLREVTREAGIAAPSFYRHFEDMNELGLSLVEESGMFLRQMLRKTRQRINEPNTAIKISVDTYLEYLKQYPIHFRLLLQEQSGNSEAFRAAVAQELGNFTWELEQYLVSRARQMERPKLDATNMAEAMIAIVINMSSKFMALPANRHDEIREHTIKQLDLVMLGGISAANS